MPGAPAYMSDMDIIIIASVSAFSFVSAGFMFLTWRLMGEWPPLAAACSMAVVGIIEASRFIF